MTREQAEEVLREKTANRCSLSDMRNFLDMATALGMLKLDAPPSAFRLLSDLLGPQKAMRAIDVIDLAGLKIVDK